MKRMNTFLRTLGVVTLVGMASLALPFPAQAGGSKSPLEWVCRWWSPLRR